MSKTHNNKTQDARSALRGYFSQARLSQEKAKHLEGLLLADGVAKTPVVRQRVVSRVRQNLLASAAGGAVAAVLAVVAVSTYYEEPDIISELASIPSARSYPPDFDLEGDASAFSSIVQEVFPAEGFATDLPEQISGQYFPSEGRFFTWAGGPGVSIRLRSREPSPASGHHPQTTLYIVRLSGKAEKKFPKENTTRRVSVTGGKEKKIQLWREGKYGFAVIQNAANE